jgi:hypothetical protein
LCHTSYPGRAAGGLRPTQRFYTESAGGVTTVEAFASAAAKVRPTTLSEGTSPRGLTCNCADKPGNIHSAPLYICRVDLLQNAYLGGVKTNIHPTSALGGGADRAELSRLADEIFFDPRPEGGPRPTNIYYPCWFYLLFINYIFVYSKSIKIIYV